MALQPGQPQPCTYKCISKYWCLDTGTRYLIQTWIQNLNNLNILQINDKGANFPQIWYQYEFNYKLQQNGVLDPHSVYADPDLAFY